MVYDYLEMMGTSSKGKGVFTKKGFKKDEMILKVNIVKIFKENGKYRSQIGVGNWVSYDPQFIHFINHSCDFNCSTTMDKEGSQSVIAMRDIIPGEELTFNYAFRNLSLSNDLFPCLCGSKNCTGLVKSWSALSENTKKIYLEKYSKYILPYLLEFELNQNVNLKKD